MAKSQHVLLVSQLFEPSVDRIIGHIERLGGSWTRFNSEELPLITSGSLRIGTSAEGTATLWSRSHEIDPKEFSSVWFRRIAKAPLPKGISPRDKEFIYGECAAFTTAFFDLIDAPWVNDRNHERRANNKFWQLRVASKLGLKIPRTCITNAPKEVLAFREEIGGQVIFKPVSGYSPLGADFSKDFAAMPEVTGKYDIEVTEEPNVEVVFSQILTDDKLDNLDALCLSPVIFQEYIPKELELRVTIVGSEIFACEMHSQDSPLTQIDFRRMAFSEKGKLMLHRTHQLPAEISQRLLRLMDELKLDFGCIDLILTPEGEYAFLEINPSGQWLWIEDLTEMPISETLAKLLLSEGPFRDGRCDPWRRYESRGPSVPASCGSI